MANERLAEIRRRVAADVTLMGTLIPPWDLAGMIDELANEVDRLRAREAATMAIVRAVADKGGEYWSAGDNVCIYCEARTLAGITGLEDDAVRHTPACPVTKARALLAKEAR